ncbi:hypothetical protein [Flavobacterium myungsuense]
MNVSVEAQIIVNVSPPKWGPLVTTEEYYYLTDIDSYYIFVNHSLYILIRVYGFVLERCQIVSEIII